MKIDRDNVSAEHPAIIAEDAVASTHQGQRHIAVRLLLGRTLPLENHMSKFRAAFKNHATKASCSGIAADGVRETIRLLAATVSELTPEAFAKASQAGVKLGQSTTVEIKGEAKKLTLSTDVVGKEASEIVSDWFGVEKPRKNGSDSSTEPKA